MIGERKIRVLTVDDHPLMRGGISYEINAQPDMQVVAEAADGQEAIALFRAHLPDITLMDIKMPGLSGIEALRSIRQEFSNARVIVLTTATGDVMAFRAFKEGAAGFLLKDSLRTELVKTIRLIHGGGRRIPPELAQQMALHVTDDVLSVREIDVLQQVAQGRSNKIIASHLDVTENTVKNHLKSILAKLNANDRTHAVMIALKRGYIDA
jgi:DNA-binding NarL/FixJ family response regulator